MGRKKQIKKNDILEAIKGSFGMTATVAARLHCDWHTADKAIKALPEAMQAMQDEEESMLDFTQGKAIEKVKDGDGSMIRFILATKGKKRGFNYDTETRNEIENDDNELKIVIEDGDE